MFDFSKYGLRASRILLPAEDTALEKWAVIACDQFTSDPSYWADVRKLTEGAPSAIDMIYPECDMKDHPADIPRIHRAMRENLDRTLTRAVNGFVLVERQTSGGNRLGLMAAIDLEAYDYALNAKPLIRATEGTVVERLPARAAIRRGAPLEIPHVMVLTDDPGKILIEPLYERRETLLPLYDFETMLGGGHLRGWAVEREEDFLSIGAALDALYRASDGMLFAVGDGNHSLAAARAYWLEKKKTLTGGALQTDPARFALVEINNLHDPALNFEPIHRAVFDADRALLTHDFILYCRLRGVVVAPCEPEMAEIYLLDEPLRFENAPGMLPVHLLQPFLDQWIREHPPARVDYIHDLSALEALNACRIRLTAMDKRALFPAVRQNGPLPRKTFSMGEARDKRYYLEVRKLVD